MFSYSPFPYLHWVIFTALIVYRLHQGSPPLDDLDPFCYTLKSTNRSDQNFMDRECLNPLPSWSHQQLSLSIHKDLKMNKLWHRKPRNLLQVGNIQNFGTLKFSLDPLNLGFAVPKGSWKIQLDTLNFWVHATPGLHDINYFQIYYYHLQGMTKRQQ